MAYSCSVRDSAFDALRAGFRAIVLLAASRGIQDNTSREAVEKMRAKGAVVIDDQADWEALLREKLRAEGGEE